MTKTSPAFRLKSLSMHLLGATLLGAPVSPALAQEAGTPRLPSEITITAQKREQGLQDVPISVATLSGEPLEAIFDGSDDVLALAARIPGVYAESSNGRAAPRFYMRGLGNVDFDLAASQPVSIVFDDVVQENVVLKSFPLFDIEQVEVIRGPQGTLFGRNTTAGIIKFDSRKPTAGTEGYLKASAATQNTTNLEAAIGGSLVEDTLMGRFSILYQDMDDWIDNTWTGDDDVMGGFEELAWRGQLLWTPTDSLSLLLNHHQRDLEGTASVFRANIFSTGMSGLNDNYDRDEVMFDEGDDNPQEYEGEGTLLNVSYATDAFTFTSITALEEADGFSLGDIDGGVSGVGPGFIPFSAVTQDNADVEQFTQEFRLASDSDGFLDWQVGYFYFDASLDVTTIDGFFGATTVFHDNESWAVFGQLSHDLTDRLTLSGGVRYTEDEKTLTVGPQNVDGFALAIDAAAIQDYEPVDVDDDQVSWELALNYHATDAVTLFARVAEGFRAPSIQARDVAFEGNPSVAESETNLSFEVGLKADLLMDRLRINAAAFRYEVDDMQLSAIGGANNGNSLLNADKGVGKGFEVEGEYALTDMVYLSMGYGYNDTEIRDGDLFTAPCGSGACTVTDPIIGGLALIHGNPFQGIPKYTFNFAVDVRVPAGPQGEAFLYSDWALQGETVLTLYEAVEYTIDDQFEGGLRVGYRNFEPAYEVALFGRNITDEDNIKGQIDFNNLTGFVNNPSIWGLEGKLSF